MKLSVVTPTFNERENIQALVNDIEASLHHTAYEIIIADDDSPDLTWHVAQEISANDPRVRVLRRMDHHGLGEAVIEGFAVAGGDVIACMDADLQHDPSVLPKMLEKLSGGAHVVVGSRYVIGGSTGNWNGLRQLASRFATVMARIFLGLDLSDPMSGYFMMRRSDFMRVHRKLRGEGFKILLEILANLRSPVIEEVPYEFRARLRGESKLSTKVVLQYLSQLWRLTPLRRLSLKRLAKFALVGCTGTLVNLSVLALLVRLTNWRAWSASVVASLVANISNYALNNSWTFSDRLHKGLSLIKGYVSYLAMSLVGLGITTISYMGLLWLVTQHSGTLEQGAFGTELFCQFLAIGIGMFSNFIFNNGVTWPDKKLRQFAHNASSDTTAISPGVTTAFEYSSGSRPMMAEDVGNSQVV